IAYLSARFVVTDTQSSLALIKGLVAPIFVIAPISLAQLFGNGTIIEFTLNFVTADGFEGKIDRGSSLRSVGLIGGSTSLGAYSSGIFALSMAHKIAEKKEMAQVSRYITFTAILSVITVLSTLTFGPIIATVVISLSVIRL